MGFSPAGGEGTCGRCLGSSFVCYAQVRAEVPRGKPGRACGYLRSAAGFPAISVAPLEVPLDRVLLVAPLGADANASEKRPLGRMHRQHLQGGMEGEVAPTKPTAGPGTLQTSSEGLSAGWEVMRKRGTFFPGDCRVVSASSHGTANRPSPSLPSLMPGAVTSLWACGVAACWGRGVAGNGECFNPPHFPTPPQVREELVIVRPASPGSVSAWSPTGVGRGGLEH